MTPVSDDTRRTMLAAERTWLAWWRTGLASAIATLAVGRLAPELVGGDNLVFGLLGGGYGALSVTFVVLGAIRQRRVSEAIEQGEYADVPGSWVFGLTVAVGVLVVATLVFVALG